MFFYLTFNRRLADCNIFYAITIKMCHVSKSTSTCHVNCKDLGFGKDLTKFAKIRMLDFFNFIIYIWEKYIYLPQTTIPLSMRPQTINCVNIPPIVPKNVYSLFSQ
jgi:hypothetical protein